MIVIGLVTAASSVMGIVSALVVQFVTKRFVYRYTLTVSYICLLVMLIILFLVFDSMAGFLVMVSIGAMFIIAVMLQTYPMLMQAVP